MMAITATTIRYRVAMPEGSTKSAVMRGRQPKDVQPADIDETDRGILNALHADARISNSALADIVGIAPSTCHGRVRRLQELGVIRGFYTDIDPAAIGHPLQAMISVSLQSNSRGKIRSFIQDIRRKRQVIDVYFLAGAEDFILHVAARDTEDLRSFVVENLNADVDVAGTQTSLIFEHLRGAAPL
jgi:DNA-binding Lrp family transcriptional regulator